MNVSSIKSGHFQLSPQLSLQLVLLGMSRKSGRICAVNGCSHSSGKLQIWKQTQCEVHKPLLHDQCPCLRPYGLHRFPGRAEDQDVREKWIRNINRGDFIPNNNSTVGFGQPSHFCVRLTMTSMQLPSIVKQLTAFTGAVCVW